VSPDLSGRWSDVDLTADLLLRSVPLLPSAAHVVGVDVVDVRVMGRQLSGELGQRFKARIFTAAEIEDCRGDHAKFASRWAAKEAVAKAIGTGFRDGLRPQMMEIVKSPAGSIVVAPSRNDIEWPLSAHLWQWAVSAAHERNLAIAIAIALRTNVVELSNEEASHEPNE
jgi:holo-[acyl-carrier protein] synthase